MARLSIFLSHSSKDKPFVRRLNQNLKAAGFNTWIDEEQIPLGGSITAEIQSGLEKCGVMLVFISESAAHSKWVENEWQVKFFQQINDRKIIVIPVLLEDCIIPKLLSDRRYADFRRKDRYDENFAILLESLNKIVLDVEPGSKRKLDTRQARGILETTVDLLDDLEQENIALPVHRRIPLLGTLKSLPRSGKHVRLEGFQPRLKIRTIYDHILSLAHLADVLFSEINHNIPVSDQFKVAFCIAYHELNEVVLGDIPTYTSLSATKRNLARVYAEQRLRNIVPSRREAIANDFVWMFMNEKHRQAFELVNCISSDEKDPIFIYFRSLDKIDPIVAVWRYLHHYRGKLGKTPEVFNQRLRDFYLNPDVRAFVEKNNMDTKLLDFVINLQDRAKAWDYYEDRSRIFGDENLFQLPKSVVSNAIEGINLYC